jgi:MoaA/NifB/PqqE/SkfB family radical SAM enzyme
MKVAIYNTYGLFKIPKPVLDRIKALGFDYEQEEAASLDGDEFRNHPALIKAIEEGIEAGLVTNITIVEIPDDVEYVIESYDGREWVAEKHRTWS